MPTYKFTIGSYPSKPSSRIKILTGQKFHRLLVLGFAGLDKTFTATWHCLCDCGNGTTVVGSVLRRHLVLSCGCYRKENAGQHSKKHPKGETVSTEYCTYSRAKNRCTNSNHPDFPKYGGRGIEFRFESYEQFLATIGRKPTPSHTLNRIDNNGHYEPNNVEWATWQEQARNRRTTPYVTIDGVTQCTEKWGEIYGLSGGTIRRRRRKGWCDICAVTIPIRKGHCSHQS